MVTTRRRWPKDGFIDDLIDELIESNLLTEIDDTSLEYVDTLVNVLRLEAEINSN